MDIPKLTAYKNNYYSIDLGDVVIWYSYQLAIAFRVWKGGQKKGAALINLYSRNTGNHIKRAIADIGEDICVRLSILKFNTQLHNALNGKSDHLCLDRSRAVGNVRFESLIVRGSS